MGVRWKRFAIRCPTLSEPVDKARTPVFDEDRIAAVRADS